MRKNEILAYPLCRHQQKRFSELSRCSSSLGAPSVLLHGIDATWRGSQSQPPSRMQVSLLFHPSFRNKQSCKSPISRHWAAKNKAGNVEACLLFTAVLKILPTLLPGLTPPKQNNSYVLLSCLRCCDGGAGRFSTKLSDGNARSLLGLPNFIYTPALIANVTYWKHVVRPGNRPVAGGKPSSCELRSFWRITPWFDGIEAKSLELLYLQVYLASERMGKIFKHGVGLLLNFLLLLLLQSLTESVKILFVFQCPLVRDVATVSPAG